MWLRAAAFTSVLLLLLRIPAFYNFVASPLKNVGKFGHDPIICGAIWSVFIVGILQGSGWLARAMEWRPLRFLGLISFSAYLWHEKFVTDVDDLPVPPILRLLAFLAIVIAVATASYFLLERPLAKIRPAKRTPLSPTPPSPAPC
jgi:peptidoglycan/LPS O-acetylase OafA/YrhL